MCLRVGALAPTQDVVREHPFQGAAEDALGGAAVGFKCPGDVPDIFRQAVVAERHPHLQPDRHAHAVLAVEQDLHEVPHVQVSHLSHQGLERVFTGKAGHIRDCLLVPCRHVIQRPQPGNQFRRQQLHPFPDHSDPGKGAGADVFRLVKPGITAEDLVRRFPGHGHCRLLLDLPAKQVQGGVDVSHPGQVPRPDRYL